MKYIGEIIDSVIWQCVGVLCIIGDTAIGAILATYRWCVFAFKKPYCAIFGHEPIGTTNGNYSHLICHNCKCFMEYKDGLYHYSSEPVPVVKNLHRSTQ